MFNVLGYSRLTPYTFALGCSSCGCGGQFPGIQNYLLTYKLPQYVTVTPSASQQIITAQGLNRYLKQVTVKAIPTTPAA